MTDAPRENGPDEPSPTVRDRRRVDPDTGTLREPENSSGPAGPGGQPSPDAATWTADGPDAPIDAPGVTGGPETSGADGDELTAAKAEAADRLEDLRRLQAEYVNYRRRVERDRESVRENARIDVLKEFLAVLDDIGRAREYGDLTGAFRSVAEAVEAITVKEGLERYGEVGDEFDPMIHEALMHAYSDDVTGPTATQVLQPGYRVGERILRPARVAVSEPEDTGAAPGSSAAQSTVADDESTQSGSGVDES